MNRLLEPPNVVSLLRIPLAGLFFAADGAAARAAVIGAAAASDFADGWLARRLDRRTRLGEMLDPLTDKIFLLSVLIAFAAAGELAAPHLALLVARDAFAVAGFAAVVALRLPVRMKARFSGKVVTVLQLAAVAALTLLPVVAPPLAWAAGLAAAWAVVDYIIAARRDLRQAPRRP